MDCSICYEKLVSGNGNAVVTTQCGHLFHEKCIKDHINKRIEENALKPPNQKMPIQCPYCNDKQLKLDNLVKLHLDIENSGMNDQILMTHIADINIKLDKTDKKNTEMLQKILASMSSMSDTMKSLQYDNEMLRKENIELKAGSSEFMPKSETHAMKLKDLMISNLQKEVNDLKNKRAEMTREMNTISEKIGHLKAAAKGEKPKTPVEARNQPITLKFDDFSDKLIIE